MDLLNVSIIKSYLLIGWIFLPRTCKTKALTRKYNTFF